MKISNFEATGLDRLGLWIMRNWDNVKSTSMLKAVLKTINISFALEEIDRVQSMLICELKDSYVQQSQRYVSITQGSYVLPVLDYNDEQKARHLTERAFDLYGRMSQLKDGEFKGRLRTQHYLYGIPIEDARYILPLSTKTNVCVAMSGDKLLDLFDLLNDKKYGDIFATIRDELLQYLPPKLIELLNETEASMDCPELVQEFYFDYFTRLSTENNLVLLERFDDLDTKAGFGALTSTSKETPSQIIEKWGQEAQAKARGVIERVLGYGHDSIAEQARTTFGMMCSLVTYHQQLRHRLSEIYREELSVLVMDKDREPKVPATIKNSRFYQEFLALVDEFKAFRLIIAEKYGENKAFSFLLNCDQIKLVMSSNARADVSMLSERTCMNAQWEIRELAIKKLKILRSLSQVLYEKALPTCVLGKCREGKLTCGQQSAVKQQFLNC